MLRAIAAAKKKNDRIDARKIRDYLRCDFLPECNMASTAIRERRRTLLYDKEKQKGNANRATLPVAREAGGLSPGGGPWAAEFSGGGDQQHRCVARGGEPEDFFDA